MPDGSKLSTADATDTRVLGGFAVGLVALLVVVFAIGGSGMVAPGSGTVAPGSGTVAPGSGTGRLEPGAPVVTTDESVLSDAFTGTYPREVRIRKMFLVRPDLMSYPMFQDFYA